MRATTPIMVSLPVLIVGAYIILILNGHVRYLIGGASPTGLVKAAAPQRLRSTTRVAKASWYGNKFAERTSASGERGAPIQLTAEAKDLPLGPIVTDENPQNRRSVISPVNDRNQQVRGRSLDLSHSSVQKLGLTRRGIATVILITIAAATRSGR